MARGRMINAKLAEDIEFNGMTLDAQHLFLRTIPHLDRDGLISGHPALLWSKVAPLVPDFLDKIPGILNEWEKAGFIVRYSDGKQPVIFFKSFAKNQTGMAYGREAASNFAPPPGYSRTGKGLVSSGPASAPQPSSDDSGATPDLLRTNSGVTQDEKKRKEDQQNEAAGAAVDGSGSAERQKAYREAVAVIEGNGFGLMTQLLSEEVYTLIDDFGAPYLLEALKVAVGRNKRQIRYVKGILENWRRDGTDPRQPKEEKPAAAAPVVAAGNVAPARLAFTVPAGLRSQ